MKYKTLCINKILKFTTTDADKKIDKIGQCKFIFIKL